MDLDTLYESLRGFKGYEAVEFSDAMPLDGTEAIVTVCSTGQGAAVKLKEFVEGILQHIVDTPVHASAESPGGWKPDEKQAGKWVVEGALKDSQGSPVGCDVRQASDARSRKLFP